MHTEHASFLFKITLFILGWRHVWYATSTIQYSTCVYPGPEITDYGVSSLYTTCCRYISRTCHQYSLSRGSSCRIARFFCDSLTRLYMRKIRKNGHVNISLQKYCTNCRFSKFKSSHNEYPPPPLPPVHILLQQHFASECVFRKVIEGINVSIVTF